MLFTQSIKLLLCVYWYVYVCVHWDEKKETIGVTHAQAVGFVTELFVSHIYLICLYAQTFFGQRIPRESYPPRNQRHEFSCSALRSA